MLYVVARHIHIREIDGYYGLYIYIRRVYTVMGKSVHAYIRARSKKITRPHRRTERQRTPRRARPKVMRDESKLSSSVFHDDGLMQRGLNVSHACFVTVGRSHGRSVGRSLVWLAGLGRCRSLHQSYMYY